jgi:release factor glutamine methyltransferase
MNRISDLQKKQESKLWPELLIILSHITKKPKHFLLAHLEHPLTFFQKLKWHYKKWSFLRGMPIAYIVGHKEFFGLSFKVNRHTLIPRPDTEVLVEEVLIHINQKINSNKNDTLHIIDIGTGSGCIPISVSKKSDHPNLKIIATDISKSALKIAKQNAAHHSAEIDFYRGNLLSPIKSYLLDLEKSGVKHEIILTANLPYLTHEEFHNEASIQYEPYSALVASEEGLGLYRKLITQIEQLGKQFSIPLSAYLEINPSQADKLIYLVKKTLPDAKTVIKQDLSGKDRVVLACINI